MGFFGQRDKHNHRESNRHQHTREQFKKRDPPPWLPSQEELFSLFEQAGFDILKESIQQFNRTSYFTSAISVLKSLSCIGATAAAEKLLNRKELDELCQDYTAMFSEAGTIPLTYHAIIGIARKRSGKK